MNNDTSNKKELIINGTLYAHYIIEKEVMWLKVRKDIIPGDKGKSENYLIELISLVERKKIPYVSYLNIK